MIPRPRSQIVDKFSAKPAGDPSYRAAISQYDGNSWQVLKEYLPSSVNRGAYAAVMGEDRLMVWQKSSYSEMAEGIFYYNVDHWINMVKGDGLPSNSIITAVVNPDGAGDVWIATDEGMVLFSEGHIIATSTAENGLSDPYTNACAR